MLVRCWYIIIPNFTFLDFMVHRKQESVSMKAPREGFGGRLYFWLGGAQSRAEHDGDEKNHCLCQETNTVIPHTAIQLLPCPCGWYWDSRVLNPGHIKELPHYRQPDWRVVQTGAGSSPSPQTHGWPFLLLVMELFWEFMPLHSISNSWHFESFVLLSS